MTLTRVTLVHIEGVVQQWLRFGRPCREAIIDRRRRHLWFAPGDRLAYVSWRANGHGTVLSRIVILAAARPGAPLTTTPGIAPGGEMLLQLSGWPRVRAALAAVDQVDGLSLDPADAAPDHWRQVHARLAIGLRPRLYDLARHAAWRRRAALTPC